MRLLTIAAASALVGTFSIDAFSQDYAPPPPQTTIVTTPVVTERFEAPACNCRDPHATRNHPFAFDIGVQGGMTYWVEGGPFGTGEGIGPGLAPGYNLGLRASFEILPWLALDGRGLVMRNSATALLQNGAYTTAGGFGAVRLTLPTQHIRPYVLLGFGDFHMSPSGARTQLVSDTASAYVGGLGATIPTGYNVEFGVEYLYPHLNSEVLSRHTKGGADGGDPSTLSLFLQYRFPL